MRARENFCFDLLKLGESSSRFRHRGGMTIANKDIGQARQEVLIRHYKELGFLLEQWETIGILSGTI